MSITVTPIPRPTNPNLLVQSGTIAMWSGLIANIPDGWFLCDGTNSTPDLRDRFIKGAADAVEAGATGGAATHTHAAHNDHAALASHQHNIALGSETNPWSNSTATHGTSGTFDVNISYALVSQFSTTKDEALSSAESAGTPDSHSAHNSPNSEPAFFVVLYIMKA